MPEPSAALSSRYLAAALRTLHDACHETGRDDDGRRCPTCCLRDLCELSRRKIEPSNFPHI
ncbi:MAG TPA: hypothetical protein VME41_09865 [Stellaceae bacterium]|nr:hypothetical protein [Stellaceae bacterium]